MFLFWKSFTNGKMANIFRVTISSVLFRCPKLDLISSKPVMADLIITRRVLKCSYLSKCTIFCSQIYLIILAAPMNIALMLKIRKKERSSNLVASEWPAQTSITFAGLLWLMKFERFWKTVNNTSHGARECSYIKWLNRILTTLLLRWKEGLWLETMKCNALHVADHAENWCVICWK